MLIGLTIGKCIGVLFCWCVLVIYLESCVEKHKFLWTYDDEKISNRFLLITVIALIIIIILVVHAVKRRNCKEPTVTTSTINIIGSNDHFAVEGSISGGILCFSGYVDEELVYYYYYKNEEGNVEAGHIPANATEIVPMYEGGIPRVETIVTSSCYMDYNYKPPKHVVKGWTAVTKYKIYVPATAITDEHIFDLD